MRTGILFGMCSLSLAPAFAGGIPLWTNVRTAISDADWQHIAARYSVVF